MADPDWLLLQGWLATAAAGGRGAVREALGAWLGAFGCGPLLDAAGGRFAGVTVLASFTRQEDKKVYCLRQRRPMHWPPHALKQLRQGCAPCLLMRQMQVMHANPCVLHSPAAAAAGAPAPAGLPAQPVASCSREGLDAALHALVAALRDRTAAGQPPAVRARAALLQWLALGEAGYQTLTGKLPNELVTYHQVGVSLAECVTSAFQWVLHVRLSLA